MIILLIDTNATIQTVVMSLTAIAVPVITLYLKAKFAKEALEIKNRIDESDRMAKDKFETADKKVEEFHKQIDGRMGQLLEAKDQIGDIKKELGKAEGVIQQAKEEIKTEIKNGH